MKALLLLMVLALAACTHQSTEIVGNTTIAQYTIDSLVAKPDTISIGDAVKVKLGIFLDCTNRITRIDTLLDTANTPHKLTLFVFGTIWIGPGPRPLCPAVFRKKEVDLVLPISGIWIIEASEPVATMQNLRDTVFVK